jgi:hypothetical protein
MSFSLVLIFEKAQKQTRNNYVTKHSIKDNTHHFVPSKHEKNKNCH